MGGVTLPLCQLVILNVLCSVTKTHNSKTGYAVKYVYHVPLKHVVVYSLGGCLWEKMDDKQGHEFT